MSKDSDYIAKLEKAIAEKYGTETIQNPKGNWDKEKEEEYIQQLKKLAEKRESEEPGEKIDAGGFLVSKKLLNRADSKNCISCGKYFFKREDDIYMSKFECCHKCYVHNIETKQNLKEMKNAQK